MQWNFRTTGPNRSCDWSGVAWNASCALSIELIYAYGLKWVASGNPVHFRPRLNSRSKLRHAEAILSA